MSVWVCVCVEWLYPAEMINGWLRKSNETGPKMLTPMESESRCCEK